MLIGQIFRILWLLFIKKNIVLFKIEPPLIPGSTKENILENFDAEIKNLTKGFK